MDCNICLQGINDKTGKTHLSCGHCFHVGCIGVWFFNQMISKSLETCPNCRHYVSNFEKMRPTPTNKSITDTALVKQTRKRFERIRFLNPESEVRLYSVNLIKACWRGYVDRKLYSKICIRNLDTYKLRLRVQLILKYIIANQNQIRFYKKLIGLNYIDRRNLCAKIIQRFWLQRSE